jgi:hypothetical protein
VILMSWMSLVAVLDLKGLPRRKGENTPVPGVKSSEH